MHEEVDVIYMIVTSVTILLFVVPLFCVYYSLKRQRKLDLRTVRRLFNYSLIVQIVLGITLYLVFLVYGVVIFGDLAEAEWFEVLLTATVWFYIIGLFYYIPAVILLNLVSEFVIRFKKQSMHTTSASRNKG